ncbi:MAG: hypothetical protein H5T43_02305 [Methanomethylovorans sp.]|nr:hypothetical protein [Methanomethylovorans sp.]
MEVCAICGGEQDSRHFKGHDICTTCADIMEDVMSEYFLRTIWKREPRAHKAYLQYLDNTIRYITAYKKLTSKSESHIKQVSNRVQNVLENNSSPHKQKYFERMQMVLKWLEKNPQFYHYYFKDFYVCPNCGSSIFEKYVRTDLGDWMVISCSECDNVIKKYYSPQLL